ncbi:hypothetical protein [Xenorhabdus szentirmaii]|uniref:hypothetical protein n=1 Tax=Xenorhabdus szentirmaii TaxID=290112 RepID=UPI00199203DF|nr:hypothetical protein [Xenorhabdus sp. 5]MBD2793987.1 hypothetical protein [Xenorhabdus sp. CUL]MBD2826937.1 hypothetical protein [Xenorhabdus sp. 5]
MRWRNKAPVACKGAHYPAVHLRTFGSRYRQTIIHRPAMKVIRCDSRPAYHAIRTAQVLRCPEYQQ